MYDKWPPSPSLRSVVAAHTLRCAARPPPRFALERIVALGWLSARLGACAEVCVSLRGGRGLTKLDDESERGRPPVLLREVELAPQSAKV